MYTLLLALIYLAFISLGLPDSLLGSGWPAIHTELGVPIDYMGIVSMIIAGMTIISSLCSDMITRKFGTRTVTTVSVFLTAFALVGFSFVDCFWMLTLLAVPYGLGAGAIDAALNNYVALHYSSRHMSWLHCFWGVGTIISPFVMSFSLTHGTWNGGYRTVGLIQMSIGLVLLVTFPVWKVNGDVKTANEKSIGLVGALKIKGVPLMLTGFFAYCATEATVMGWASTYMAQVRGSDASQAAKYGSLFFIGMTVGRFAAGFVMNRIGDRYMIRMGTAVLFCGVALIALSVETPMIAVIGFVVIGLGCAPIYPCIIHSTPSNFGAKNSGAIIGIQMASAYAGSTFMPPLFGFFGKRIGFEIMPLYLAVFAVPMIILVELTYKTAANQR